MEPATSFFSSVFPKENVGAAGSLFACKDPKAALPCDALVASPSLPNTGPAELVVVTVLLFVDVMSFDDVSLDFS